MRRELFSIKMILLGSWLFGLASGFAWSQQSPRPTPLEHVVVIFQENQSFDHYFATYPNAANLAGEPPFHAAPGTPTVNGLSETLRAHNPNSVQPWRISRSQAVSVIAACDNDHGYTAEQNAYDRGLVDKFVEFTGSRDKACAKNFVMGYVDGNTVTAVWNYAQHFALNDNFFGTTFGPSMLGAINLASGQTGGAVPENVPGTEGSPYTTNGTMVGNPPAAFDDCAEAQGGSVQMTGKNIGDLLNARQITWGWFAAGFTPTHTTTTGTAICGRSHTASNGQMVPVYDDPDPFEYYKSTANPHHLPPSALNMVGRTDQANHQYDLDVFWDAAKAGHLPAVSFLRGPEYSDGHPGYSDPLTEQQFLVTTINRLQKLPEWHSMVIFLTWDDSDGWYDHVMPPIVNHSQDAKLDTLLGPQGLCGSGIAIGGYQGRCAYGPRIPLLIISPFSRVNFVDHSLTDQTSLIKFIEDNWDLGGIGGGSFDALAGSVLRSFDFEHPHPAPLQLDPETGEPSQQP
ncbi:MAG: alkaline phosphatase family protein [Candidatus Sulfotelmatobacter sp.]